MNKYKILFVFLAVFFLLPALSFSAITLPWSTTYNCGAWTQADGLSTTAVNCDGTSGGGGGWTCNGTEEQITSLMLGHRMPLPPNLLAQINLISGHLQAATINPRTVMAGRH